MFQIGGNGEKVGQKVFRLFGEKTPYSGVPENLAQNRKVFQIGGNGKKVGQQVFRLFGNPPPPIVAAQKYLLQMGHMKSVQNCLKLRENYPKNYWGFFSPPPHPKPSGGQ